MEYREDKLTETIIRCIIQLHQTLGPGFLEKIYRSTLLIFTIPLSPFLHQSRERLLILLRFCASAENQNGSSDKSISPTS
jgi:hypothetical protein